MELERITEQKNGEKERGQNGVPNLGLSDPQVACMDHCDMLFCLARKWQNKVLDSSLFISLPEF